MLEPTDPVQLPKGQAFTLIDSGRLHKIRMPLPEAAHDPLMPPGLAAIGEALRRRRDGANRTTKVRITRPRVATRTRRFTKECWPA
jgi:hypothetical protein